MRCTLLAKPWRPSRINDQSLAEVCLHCLEKDPHNRYPSASDLIADLQRAREGHATVAEQVIRRRLRQLLSEDPALCNDPERLQRLLP